jgi:hypothetical protein
MAGYFLMNAVLSGSGTPQQIDEFGFLGLLG